MDKATRLSFYFGPLELSVEHGDWLGAQVDAIVCPIDKDLSLRFGPAEAVRDAEGPSLIGRLREATQGFKAPLGSAFKIQATRLQVPWIFFVVTYEIAWSNFKEGFIDTSLRSVFEQSQRGKISSLALVPLGHPTLSPIPPAREILESILRYARRLQYVEGVGFIRIMLADNELFKAFSAETIAFHNEAHRAGRIPSTSAEQKDTPLPETMLDLQLPKAEKRPKEKPPEQPLAGDLGNCSVIAITPADSELSKLPKNASQLEFPLSFIPSLAQARNSLPGRRAEVVVLDYDALYLGDSVPAVLQEIRDLTNPEVGTILMADNYLFDTMLDAVAGQVDAFLPKPISLASLRQAVLTAQDKRTLRAAKTKLFADLATLNKMQERFLHMVSHDLRAPLTVFKGGLELLMAHFAPPQTEKAAAYFKMLQNSCLQMQGLVNDLTDFAGMKEGKFKIESVEAEPCALLKGICDAFEILAQKQGVRLKREFPAELPRLKLDPERIRQVLMNLLGNSLKHTPKGGSITLSALHADGEVRFAVVDTGEGIDPQELPRIFEAFYQAPSATLSKEGLGLGLAISREIITRHGGTIQAQSSGRGKGLRVEFRLPVP